MDIELTLRAVGELADHFKGKGKAEKLIVYSAIQPLIVEIRAYADEIKKDRPTADSADRFIGEMITPLRALAGLENNCHDDGQNMGWVRTSLHKLASSQCFNVVI